MVDRFLNTYIVCVTQKPKSVLLAIACLAIFLAWGLPNFKLDASADSLTLEHDTDLDFFRDMSTRYQSGDFLVITFKPQQELFSVDSLELLKNLRDELKNIAGITSINSILDVPLLYSPKQSLTEIAGEPRTLESHNVDYALAREEFLSSPIYRELILGPDGQTTAMQLNLSIDQRYIDLVRQRDALRLQRKKGGLSEAEAKELAEVSQTFLDYRTRSEARAHERVEEVRAVVARYKDKAEIFVGGVTMITADMISFIKSDLVVFGTAVVIFMIAVLAVIFRRLRFVVIPMLTCLIALLMMLGFISWLDWRLTVISSNFVALLLIISLAIIIHLVVRYREYAEENPHWTQSQLVEATVRFMARPCLYTALTTIVAFASLVVSDIRPVIDFGWMMTIGLVVALVLAFLLLPACLMLLPKLAKQGESENPVKPKAKPLTLYLSAVVERHGAAVLLLSALVLGLSIWGIARLQVENRFIDYFHKDTEIYQGLSVIDNELGGTIPLDILVDASAEDIALVSGDIPSDEEDPFADDDSYEEEDPFASTGLEAETDLAAEEDPFVEDGASVQSNYWFTVAGLNQVEELHDYLDSLPEVGNIQSLAIFYKVGKDINGSLNDFELAVLKKSLPTVVNDVLVKPFLAPNSNQTRVTLRIKDSYPNLKRAELVERIRNDIDQKLSIDVENIQFSGLLVLYNNMLQSLFGSQIVTLGAVFLGIIFMFMVLFRSLVVAIVAIVPNILAALAILGSMGLMGIPLDMMTITVAAITVGIGVDDTIHYIHRFKTELTKDGDYMATMHRAHGSIGRAMYYTSVIIIFGFSIMALSEFIPTIYFGLLTGMAMLVALLGALLLLPKLILIVKPFKVENLAHASG